MAQTRTRQSPFWWVGFTVVIMIVLAFWFGTKMLFVAGAIVLLAFSVAVIQSAIHIRREKSQQSGLGATLKLLPHILVLALVMLLLGLTFREALRNF